MSIRNASAVTSTKVLPFPPLQSLEESGRLTPATPATLAATPPATLPTEHFVYRGREYRLFKRSCSNTAPWQFQLERAGKRYRHSLGTTDKATGIAKAKLLLEAADKNQLDAMRAIVSPRPAAPACSPLSKLIESFERMPLDISDTHRRNCVYSLKSVLIAAGAGDPLTLDASVLTEATARAYFDARILVAKKQRSQEDQARIKRSANSTFAQALCMFRPKVLSAYRREGLLFPDVQPFIEVFAEEKFTGITPVYLPPQPAVIRKTLHAWLKLTDRNMFIAIGLELACGLRKAEVSQTTWAMFTSSKDGALLDGRGAVKNSSGRFVVPPIDPFWTLLNRRIDREKWRGKPDELVLTGHHTERTDCTFRNTGSWLRALGWSTQKTNHALRAYAGSLVAMKFGLYRASAWLRHASVKVTQSHYTHFLDGRVFRPENVLIRWARPATQKPAQKPALTAAVINAAIKRVVSRN